MKDRKAFHSMSCSNDFLSGQLNSTFLIANGISGGFLLRSSEQNQDGVVLDSVHAHVHAVTECKVHVYTDIRLEIKLTM